jgi:FlaA1/EpsC-like NDP-sugar epimerase
VAFSDGSLLHGFVQRVAKRKPIAAPTDVRRYFITEKEAGELCLLSCLIGDNRDIFFPKASSDLPETKFSDIAINYLITMGFEPVLCESEAAARASTDELIQHRQWPCYFFESDTTGEKDFEEFFTPEETINLERFSDIGIVKGSSIYETERLNNFTAVIDKALKHRTWTRDLLVDLFRSTLPNFAHKETGRYLDDKM